MERGKGFGEGTGVRREGRRRGQGEEQARVWAGGQPARVLLSFV